jgi:VWFA-related protein
MPTPRAAVLIALILVIAFSTPAQPPANPALPAVQALSPSSQAGLQVPTIHVTARTVILDVIVTDNDGNPVRGLKPSAFALTEDGVPQKFSAFTEFSPSAAPPVTSVQPLPPNTFAVQPPPPESVAKTIIVLDQIHYPNYPMVRDDISAFLKTAAPGNPTAIIRLDWQGLHLVQDFTSDPEILRQTVASERMLPPIPDIQCGRYEGVIDPYGHIARYIAGIPGRINLAWVTDEGGPGNGFPVDYHQLNTFVRNQYASTDDLHVSRVVPYFIKAGGYIGGILQPISDLAPDAQLKLLFPGSHLVLPPDCPLMPPAQGSLLANAELADKAVELGGHAFFNGTTKALAQIVVSGSDYYELSYVPTNPNWNGAYRKIAINVSGIPQTPPARFGWSDYGQPKVAYRGGYYARSTPDPRLDSGSPAFGLGAASSPESARASASPAAARHPPDAALAAAMGFGVATPAQVQFTVQVTPAAQTEVLQPGAPLSRDNFLAAAFRGQPYRNHRIHYWIDPQRLKFTRTPAGVFRDDLQFAAIVYGDDGLVVNSISATAHIQASADDLETILASGVTFDQTIAIPAKGDAAADHFFLRTGVMEVSSGHVGVIEIPADQVNLPPAQSIANASPQP